MTLGGSNTPVEALEIDVPSIVESATEHISLDGTGEVSIPNGDLTDGTNVIYDQSASEIPDSAMGSIANSTLTNSSVTVTAGTGLLNGGTVALGGSITLDIDDARYVQTAGDSMSGTLTLNNALALDASAGDRMALPQVTSTPTTTNPGDIYYRSDLD